MYEQDNISNLILTHWNTYHPAMVAQFRRENRLEAEVEATAERFVDLLYSQIAEKKIPYATAWETTIREILLPEPEESSLTNRNQKTPNPPAISASPPNTE